MLIIPAIDIYEDKIVRLKKGDFSNITFYKNSPLEQAKLYKSKGFDLIHIVDLVGSKSGELTVLDTVKKIKDETGLKIEFGGGIRDIKSVEQLFSAGANFVIVGSLSIKNKTEFELIVEKYSPENIIIALDSDNEKIKVRGWTESTEVSVPDHINYCTSIGINKYLCTDISKDGMMEGTNIDLYKRLMDKFPNIKLTASGGVRDINDIIKLKEMNVYGVVVGKAIYENRINLEELVEIAAQKDNSMS